MQLETPRGGGASGFLLQGSDQPPRVPLTLGHVLQAAWLLVVKKGWGRWAWDPQRSPGRVWRGWGSTDGLWWEGQPCVVSGELFWEQEGVVAPGEDGRGQQGS